jgi:hypothetical protein
MMMRDRLDRARQIGGLVMMLGWGWSRVVGCIWY